LRSLSLHILDLIENSVRAGSSIVSVTIVGSPNEDKLEITVEDNGCGTSASTEEITNPFYTTKNGKRTGLGLGLFRAAAERAGGQVTVCKSELGGVAVKATMRLGHVDRSPLGDLATTLSSVVCTNPELNLRCRFRVNDREYIVLIPEVVEESRVGACRGLAVARRVSEKVNAVLASLEVKV
jgi:anti-sigma regulatory factor (Ser/Thr protein kinase)